MASPHRKVIFQLFAVFLAAFILRVDRLDYPLSDVFAWGDGARDYLVASHIAKYGEIPLNGPYNLLAESGIYNSPIYFYVLALPLLFFNHPLTLGVVNIFLQILTLVLVFLIAKAAFNGFLYKIKNFFNFRACFGVFFAKIEIRKCARFAEAF